MTARLGPSRELNSWLVLWPNEDETSKKEKGNENENESSSDKKEEVPEVAVDDLGHPILLTCHAIQLKSWQDVVCDIFTKAYMRITKHDKVHVPWLELVRMPTKYLDADTIPEGFEMLDPSKLTKVMISCLWSYWVAQAKVKVPILIFIKAWRQDLGLSAGLEVPWVVNKRKLYVEVESGDNQGDDDLDGHAGKGKDGVDKSKGISAFPC
ncbi:hypothetical protein J3R82DRAFT_183 [Butyriboletus roseoflavus]|nr:hypothetical protein J3R82DRAFT_183 [Butyriboletus roseoflavus]